MNRSIAILIFLGIVIGSESSAQMRQAPGNVHRVPPCVTPEAWIPKLEDPVRDRDGNYVDDEIDSGGDGPLNLILCLNGCPSDEDRSRFAGFGSIVYESPYVSLLILAGVMKEDAITLGDDLRVGFVQLDRPAHFSLGTSAAAMKVTSSSQYRGDTLEDAYPWLRGQGVNIAIIDSGVDFGHESLPHWKFVGGWDFGTLPGMETNPDDTNGHGTHVASIAAGAGGPNGARGVAPLANIIDLRVDPPSEARVVAAIDKCIEKQVEWNIQIINLSLGGGGSSDGSDPMSVAADRAVEAGIVVVAAVGNDKELKIPGPAAGERVIAVSALDDRGSIDRSDDNIWCDSPNLGSNFGPRIDDGDAQTEDERKPTCAAPGRSIRAARWDSSTGYDLRSGTSMAAPHVAGVAALIRQQFPGLDPSKVRQRIVSASVPLGGARWEPDVGYGHLDAFAAVDGGVIENLGLAGGWTNRLDNGKIAASISEGDQGGVDLNGDGDAEDRVLHIFDPQSLDLVNLGITSVDDVRSSGSFYAFLVRESHENRDLNGDGDLLDIVLHAYDDDTGVLTNYGISANELNVSAEIIAFCVNEESEGEDRNSDGDAEDRVVHVIDRQSGQMRNLGLATRRLYLQNELLLFPANENDQEEDLNGDGALWDNVLHYFVIESGVVVNTRMVVGHLLIDGDWVMVGATERHGTGSVDLNGDGDVLDQIVPHMMYVPDRTIVNSSLAGFLMDQAEGVLILKVGEENQGETDLNGDGDMDDYVLHSYDAERDVTFNSGLAVNRNAEIGSGVVAFLALESRQRSDLNGDGDQADHILHTLDLDSLTVTNLAVAALGVRIEDGRVIYFADEQGQSQTDLNGDGDANDLVLAVRTLSTGRIHNVGFATDSAQYDIISFFNGAMVFEASEPANGQVDLNGDGDSLDPYVFFTHHLRTNQTTNHRVAAVPWFVTGGKLFFEVWEADQGGTDLNGDGDAEDDVLHFMTDI